jgi:antitoxin component YwqK of YwqJK toxin-antitoxin module
MKPLLILILFLSFTLNSFGQADSGFTNKAEAKNQTVNGLKEGKWIEYITQTGGPNSLDYADYILTIYEKGVPVGIQRKYGNGKVLRETHYTNGKKNGIERIFYREMAEGLKSETLYIDGAINGVEKEYNGQGKLIDETIYTNGVKGATTNYSGNGMQIK